MEVFISFLSSNDWIGFTRCIIDKGISFLPAAFAHIKVENNFKKYTDL